MRILLHLMKAVWLTWRMSRRGDDFETRSRIRRVWYARALSLAGVRFRVTGTPPERASLVVANHVSWLDIPLIGATTDPCFLSKDEIARWPVIGWLARHHDTRFIRRGAGEANAHIEAMREGLDEGRHFVVFPEGTTSRGQGVRRFHPRLFAAVTENEHPVQPVALDYERPEDGPVPVAYADDDRLIPNAWRLLCRRETRVQLHFLESLATGGEDRRSLAEASRDAIVTRLGLPTEPPDPPATKRRKAR